MYSVHKHNVQLTISIRSIEIKPYTPDYAATTVTGLSSVLDLGNCIHVHKYRCTCIWIPFDYIRYHYVVAQSAGNLYSTCSCSNWWRCYRKASILTCASHSSVTSWTSYTLTYAQFCFAINQIYAYCIMYIWVQALNVRYYIVRETLMTSAPSWQPCYALCHKP